MLGGDGGESLNELWEQPVPLHARDDTDHDTQLNFEIDLVGTELAQLRTLEIRYENHLGEPMGQPVFVSPDDLRREYLKAGDRLGFGNIQDGFLLWNLDYGPEEWVDTLWGNAHYSAGNRRAMFTARSGAACDTCIANHLS